MLFIKDCSCCPAFILNGAWKALPCKAMAHTHKSYCQAACALIRHLPLYISFLEMIRDKKDSGLFNHMEQNVYKATYPIGQCIESCDYYIEYHTNPNIFAHYINIYTGTYHHISHHNSPHPGIAVNITMSHVSLPRSHRDVTTKTPLQTEVDFLGHHISPRGIEPNTSKVDRILHWPTPKCTTDVCAFLGLVCYIAVFLPKLVDHTTVLTPLTTKECRKIEHLNPGDNKIFVTCDASDWRTGMTLSFGPTWPVAFDSMQLKGAEKNYPVHEKELLSIIWALKKWRSDLLGTRFFVYTDHRTLENFDTQKDLSC